MNRKLLLPLYFLISGINLFAVQASALALENEGIAQQAGIPIHLEAEKSGFITLVVEDKDGNRLKIWSSIIRLRRG